MPPPRRGRRCANRLVASEAVDHLRRIWETLSLNVLDGPAAASGVPDAWAELIADWSPPRAGPLRAGRLRPEGFA